MGAVFFMSTIGVCTNADGGLLRETALRLPICYDFNVSKKGLVD